MQEKVDFLESKGYKAFPCVLDVLYEFGGLRCSFTRPNGYEDSFYVNPEEAYGLKFIFTVSEQVYENRR